MARSIAVVRRAVEWRSVGQTGGRLSRLSDCLCSTALALCARRFCSQSIRRWSQLGSSVFVASASFLSHILRRSRIFCSVHMLRILAADPALHTCCSTTEGGSDPHPRLAGQPRRESRLITSTISPAAWREVPTHQRATPGRTR